MNETDQRFAAGLRAVANNNCWPRCFLVLIAGVN